MDENVKFIYLFISYIMSISLCACLYHANLASILGFSWGIWATKKELGGSARGVTHS
jgi:hypothetical protein